MKILLKKLILSLCLVMLSSIQTMQLPEESVECSAHSIQAMPANSIDNALTHAVIKGQSAQVAELLKARANPNHLTEYGSSMLIKTALYKDTHYTEITAYLLQHGARVGHKNKHGMNPLMIACKEGHADTVSLLLAYCKPEDISVVNNQGETSLMLAAASGNPILISLLAAYPLEIEKTNNYGETALIYWLENPQAHPDGLKKLLALQAQADVCDRYNNTALSLAVQNHEPAITLSLLKNLDTLALHRVDQLLKNSDGYTFLEELTFCKKNPKSHRIFIENFIKKQAQNFKN